jgi:CBS domain-containing protein
VKSGFIFPIPRRLGHAPPPCAAQHTTDKTRGRRICHLPVLDSGRLVGIISIGDLVKTIIAEQQFMIAQLEHYISG